MISRFMASDFCSTILDDRCPEFLEVVLLGGILENLRRDRIYTGFSEGFRFFTVLRKSKLRGSLKNLNFFIFIGGEQLY